MAIFFSRSKGGFYDEAIHGTKGAKGSKIPKDAVEVAPEDHAALFEAQGEGQSILVGEGGAPIAGVYVPTDAEILDTLRRKRDRDLAGSDWSQLADSSLSAAARQAWAVYRQALRDYIALVEAAIAAEADPFAVPYPVPPAITAPQPEPGGPGFEVPDEIEE